MGRVSIAGALNPQLRPLLSAMVQHAASKDSGSGVQLTPQQREEFNQLEAKAGAAAFKITQERDDLRAAQKVDAWL